MSPRSYAEPKSECYVSIDIETGGPVPGMHPMLSLGAVAFFEDGEIDHFYAKLYPEPGTVWHPDTKRFWDTQPLELRRELFSGRQLPGIVMHRFGDWVDNLPGDRKVAVAWPAAFDFPYVNWYCHRYLGRNPLGYACLDIRSYADGIARNPRYYGLGEDEVQNLVGRIDKSGLTEHNAQDDAIAQGRLFIGLSVWCRAQTDITSTHVLSEEFSADIEPTPVEPVEPEL